MAGCAFMRLDKCQNYKYILCWTSELLPSVSEVPVQNVTLDAEDQYFILLTVKAPKKAVQPFTSNPPTKLPLKNGEIRLY